MSFKTFEIELAQIALKRLDLILEE